MSARRRLVALLIGAGAAAAAAQATPPPPQPTQTFRTGTDIVFVDVSVREGGRPVTGLTAADFELTDNGVRQAIEAVEATSVPIDLTLVADVSGSPHRPWAPGPGMDKQTAALQRDVERIAGMLRPDDRLRLMAIDRDVQLVFPFSHATAIPPLARVETDGLPALYDTLLAALLHPVEPARRHVVIAAAKGIDAISSVDARAVAAVARESDARFHLVMLEQAGDSEAAVSAFQCQMMGYCWPTTRFWTPFERRLLGPRPQHALLPDGQALLEAADATGGGLHKTMVLTEPTLVGTFTRAFEDFRSSYVLRYTPRGVARHGWHQIEVRVPRARGYTVRARRGYGLEDLPPPAPKPSAPGLPGTLDAVIEAYDTRQYERTVMALRAASDPDRLLREFETRGNPWPSNPRLEAAFVLDLTEAGVFSRTAAHRERAYGLLERFTRLVRHPLALDDSFERVWHFAALAMLEGSLRPAHAEAFVTRALERFPAEPRFLLSRAILADQKTVSRGVGPIAVTAPLTDETVTEVRRHYETALAHEDTAVEARIRLAWLVHRAGQSPVALEALRVAGSRPILDPALGYLHSLIEGHVLMALERPDEAASSYRRALGIAPTAQSARVSLMNALLLNGDHDGAEALAAQVQAERSQFIDPWWLYWQGQYRLHQPAMARLRELMQP